MAFTEEDYKNIAAQLRKPNGEFGTIIAENMNTGNLDMNLNAIKYLDISDHQRILEIGMGNGFFVKNILSSANSVRYIGCDYSEDMVSLSEIVNRSFVENETAQFFHTSAHKLPVQDHSIDSLFTVNTLYFWDDHDAILTEIKRVLTSNGKFVVAIRPEEVMELYPPTKYDFDFYSMADAKNLLLEHGFEILESHEFEEKPVIQDGQSFPPKHVIIVATNAS